MRRNEFSRERIEEITVKLLDYCKKNNWAGYDPYDALNSKLLRYLPFLDFRVFRIGLTQLLKRSPINIRRLLLIPKIQNPKALALFLKAFLKLERLGLLEDKALIPLMIQRLIDLRSPQELIAWCPKGNSSASQPATMTAGKPSSFSVYQPSCNELSAVSSERSSPYELSAMCCEPSYWCWGYSFPWQTREVLVPRGAPNLVCTYFVANALLDAFERYGEPRYLSMAASAGEYILNELYWTSGDSIACFSYFRYPMDLSPHQVHNVNLLGSALLCRIHYYSGEKKFLEPALKVARYSATKQRDDGSWDYGEHTTHGWIDNFHTGYKLCSLQTIGQCAETSEFEHHIRRGFEFYRNCFFRQDGAPRYFHDSTYPIDIHCVAQSIITLLSFKDLDEGNADLAWAVFKWAVANMWDEKGYFYYQVGPFLTTKIPYMRWSQAWMVLALSKQLEDGEEGAREGRR